MRKNDSLELKIIRVALPLLIYYGILLLVQTAFGVFAMVKNFLSIGESDAAGYILAYHFLDRTDEYIQNHSLVVMFIAALITMVILSVIMKKDSGKTVFTGKEQMGLEEVLLIGLMGIFAASGLGRFVSLFQLDNLVGSYAQVSEGFAGNPMVFQILTLCIAAPAAEEMIFRGMMYQRLSEYVDKMTAVVVSSIVFGVYHGNLVQGIYALILGILLCFVFESCGTLLAPVFLHMACNTAALIIMYLPISRYISNNIVLNIIVMMLELGGMAFFTWKLYKRKNVDLDLNTSGKEE